MAQAAHLRWWAALMTLDIDGAGRSSTLACLPAARGTVAPTRGQVLEEFFSRPENQYPKLARANFGTRRLGCQKLDTSAEARTQRPRDPQRHPKAPRNSQRPPRPQNPRTQTPKSQKFQSQSSMLWRPLLMLANEGGVVQDGPN